MRILHIAKKNPSPKFTHAAFRTALAEIGEVSLIEKGLDLSEADVLGKIRETDVYLSGHGSICLPEALAADAGRLRYVCHLTGTVQGFVPRALFDAGLPVSNWGDAPAFHLGESCMTLLLAMLKDIPLRVRAVSNGEWGNTPGMRGGSIQGLSIGIYGYGFSGKAFHELIRPFRPRLKIFDPYVEEIPADAVRVQSLRELFEDVQAICIHAALTEQTRGSVTRELLARLPDGGIVVNTARGDIVDEEALFEELRTGRLRAGLDVLAGPDWLPPEHPARDWPNLLLSCHTLPHHPWPESQDLHPYHKVCLDNLRRFQNGRPLRFLLNGDRLARST